MRTRGCHPDLLLPCTARVSLSALCGQLEGATGRRANVAVGVEMWQAEEAGVIGRVAMSAEEVADVMVRSDHVAGRSGRCGGQK